MTDSTWVLTPLHEIQFVPGLLFRRHLEGVIFKVTGYHKESELVSWRYKYEFETFPEKHTELALFSQTHYYISHLKTKEERVIAKIKELNKRYADRRASL
jgi:hypothetical protein